MRDPLEHIAVAVNGQQVAGWSSVAIDISVEQAARTAALTISDFEGSEKLLPGDECSLTASGDLLLTGYVRDVSPSHDGYSHRVDISIVSRTIDAVEASIEHPTGFLENKDITEIAKAFDSSGVGIVSDESFPKEPRSFRNLGSSLYHHLVPLARSHAAFLYDTAEGKLRIARKPRGRHAGSLTVGDSGNIIDASARISEAGRHDEIIVRGQSSRGTGGAALRIEARAKDAGVRRRRPKIIVHESEATSAKLKERAERYARRAAGFSREANITVAGWRDAAGQLFEPHFLISVINPRIYIEQDMVIKSIRLVQEMASGTGTRASLTLCDPAALNGETAAVAAQWQTPDVQASISTWGG